MADFAEACKLKSRFLNNQHQYNLTYITRFVVVFACASEQFTFP